MYPELLVLGPIVISSFGAMMVAAFLSCNYLLKREMINASLDEELADELTTRAALGGILGAKLYYIIENIPNGSIGDTYNGLINILIGLFTLDSNSISMGIQTIGAGLVFYGGLIGGTIAVTLYAKRENYKWFDIADWIAPYLALGHAIGRIGCFLVGDDYGKQCDYWYCIAFPNGLPPTVFPVYPTQLFEMAAYFIIFLYLRLKRKNESASGNLIAKYLILVGISRFFIEFIRVNPKYILGLSGAQVISFIMIVLGLFLYSKLNKK